MRIAVLTPFWQRLALSDAAMGHMAALRDAVAPDIELSLHAAISEPEYRPLCEKHGYTATWSENLPRGRKNNAAMPAVRAAEPDGMFVMGSDDFCDEAYLRTAAERLAAGNDIWGVTDIYFFQPSTGRMIHWPGYPQDGTRAGETIGAGRILSRKFLEMCDWLPWDSAAVRTMDKSMMRKAWDCGDALTLGSDSLASIGAFLCDVKTETNLTKWETLIQAQGVERVDLEWPLGDGILAKIKETA